MTLNDDISKAPQLDGIDDSEQMLANRISRLEIKPFVQSVECRVSMVRYQIINVQISSYFCEQLQERKVCKSGNKQLSGAHIPEYQ